ncbi:MAG: hypothetical protein QM538_02625, partial [Methylacidiphilales bacterium]|nr:hypothetical protein [Candidatus Methylacidiphilales bacterium]
MFVVGFTISSYSEEGGKDKHYHVIGGAFRGYVSKGDSIYDSRVYDLNDSYNSKTAEFESMTTKYESQFYSYLYLSESNVGFEITVLTDLSFVKLGLGTDTIATGSCHVTKDRECMYDVREFVPKVKETSGFRSPLRHFSILFGVSQNNYLSIDLDYSRDDIKYKLRNAKKVYVPRCISEGPYYFRCLAEGAYFDFTHNYLFSNNLGMTLSPNDEPINPKAKFNGIFSPDGIGIGMRH